MAQASDRLIAGRAAALLLLTSALALAASSCAETRVELTMSWLLGDGRSCAAAGVESIEVAVTSALRASSRFPCEDGFAPAVVELGAFETGVVKIEVRALSADEVVLYRAEGLADLHGEHSVARMQLEPVEMP